MIEVWLGRWRQLIAKADAMPRAAVFTLMERRGRL